MTSIHALAIVQDCHRQSWFLYTQCNLHSVCFHPHACSTFTENTGKRSVVFISNNQVNFTGVNQFIGNTGSSIRVRMEQKFSSIETYQPIIHVSSKLVR